jgi:hypothetical protein
LATEARQPPDAPCQAVSVQTRALAVLLARFVLPTAITLAVTAGKFGTPYPESPEDARTTTPG